MPASYIAIFGHWKAVTTILSLNVTLTLTCSLKLTLSLIYRTLLSSFVP